MSGRRDEGQDARTNGTQEVPEFLRRVPPEVRAWILEMAKETWKEREAVDRHVWEVARRRGIFGISTST